MMHSGFGLGGFLVIILMVVFWVVVVGVAVWLVSRLFPRASSNPQGRNGSIGTQTASDILKQRYARGEITKAEYEEMRHTIEQ